MGDWCSKADTKKPKETPAKVDVDDPAVVPVRRKQSSYIGEVFALDRGLLMGDPLPSGRPKLSGRSKPILQDLTSLPFLERPVFDFFDRDRYNLQLLPTSLPLIGFFTFLPASPFSILRSPLSRGMGNPCAPLKPLQLFCVM